MDKRRVLLLCTQPLLGEGLESILSKLEDVELIGPLVLEPQVLSQLSEAAPDIVLVADDEGRSEGVASLTAQILGRYPDLPIVRINLTENVIRVYASQTLPARSADLIDVIRSLPAYQPGERP